jgi:hypothetical protein
MATLTSRTVVRRSLRHVVVPAIAAIVVGLATIVVIRATGLVSGWSADLVLAVIAGAIAATAVADRAAFRRGIAVPTWYDELHREFDRARRHGRPFALIRAELPTSSRRRLVGVMDGLARQLPEMVGTGLRITDRVWVEDDALVVLAPEADQAAAQALAARLQDAMHEGVGSRSDLRWSIAVFPDDGLTTGALLAALDHGARGRSLPSPISPLPAPPSATTGPGDDVAATVS